MLPLGFLTSCRDNDSKCQQHWLSLQCRLQNVGTCWLFPGVSPAHRLPCSIQDIILRPSVPSPAMAKLMPSSCETDCATLPSHTHILIYGSCCLWMSLWVHFQSYRRTLHLSLDCSLASLTSLINATNIKWPKP